MAGELIIRQLEGPRRVLRLSGRALPAPGFSMPTRQRGRLRHYHGSTEAQALLEGPEELPTTFTFNWRSRWLAAKPGSANLELIGPITDADQLVDLVKQMVRESVLVSVDWNGREPVGFLREVDPRIGRPGEWSVDLEVEWAIPDRFDLARSLEVSSREGVVDVLGSMLQAWAEALAVLRVPAALSRTALASAESAIGKVNAGFRQAAGVVGEYRAAVVDFDAVTRAAGTAMATIVTGAGEIRDAIDHPAAVLADTDDAAAALDARAFAARLARAAAAARRRAIVERRRLLLERDADLLGFYTAKDGDDLRLVCWRLYGSAEVWQQVGAFNDLAGSELPAGRVIKLPRLESL